MHFERLILNIRIGWIRWVDRLSNGMNPATKLISISVNIVKFMTSMRSFEQLIPFDHWTIVRNSFWVTKSYDINDLYQRKNICRKKNFHHKFCSVFISVRKFFVSSFQETRSTNIFEPKKNVGWLLWMSLWYHRYRHLWCCLKTDSNDGIECIMHHYVMWSSESFGHLRCTLTRDMARGLRGKRFQIYFRCMLQSEADRKMKCWCKIGWLFRSKNCKNHPSC